MLRWALPAAGSRPSERARCRPGPRRGAGPMRVGRHQLCVAYAGLLSWWHAASAAPCATPSPVPDGRGTLQGTRQSREPRGQRIDRWHLHQCADPKPRRSERGVRRARERESQRRTRCVPIGASERRGAWRLRRCRRYLSLGDITAVSGMSEEEARSFVDGLIKGAVLFRGLTLRCGHCRDARWYRTEDLGQMFPCKRCRNDNPVTHESRREADGKPIETR